MQLSSVFVMVLATLGAEAHVVPAKASLESNGTSENGTIGTYSLGVRIAHEQLALTDCF